MILEQRRGMSMALDIGAWERGESEWICYLGKQLIATLRAEGNNVESNSFRGRVRPATALEYDRLVTVEWFPHPDKPVQFVGGPWDGETLTIPAEHIGWGGRYVRTSLPQSPAFVEIATLDKIPPPPPPTFAYECIGIDTRRDRWVYQFNR